jgi:hypothetical protein
MSQMNPQTQQWDVLMVAGNNWSPYERITEYCLRVRNCFSAAGYIVKRHYYDTLISNFREGLALFMRNPSLSRIYSLDVYWRKLQIRDKWFLLIPQTVDQWNNNYSDIEKRVVSYSNLMLDPYKRGMWVSEETKMKHDIEMSKYGSKRDKINRMKMILSM